ncbi:hypothetical protein SAMN04487895_101775 [Paenibacillus sophorae]|uniref:Discoidin domain-containing protein n=1 Tax=Paenibacillus sophorae TaxID=1333845 RepID=A0A1H8H7I1_9BACL|nr:hypothetical protein [Paenibacillus sophorae]QWU14465.1 discoidin domain-containing protein [Paenibacillus sophorae]SEN51974.1 hypothetical protein SAMN04487895_101775 [Paenibacillus sophorae]
MAIPASTGQLRTKISNMEIGDYIICKYVASSGVVGTFSELGTSVAAEISTSAAAAPNGAFYFVKIDKGLLCSDRVIQHTISWDTLNAAKVIQGLPWAADNLIPTMTSNTTPSGIVSASSFWTNDPRYDAWKAFEPLTSADYAWYSGAMPTVGSPQDIAYDFGSPKKIGMFRITAPTNTNASPKTFTFEGWDGSQWIVIQSYSLGTSWSAGEKKTFYANNSEFFNKYRINITANDGNTSYTGISYLEMSETGGNIRSFSGGVAPLDTNQGASTSGDKGLGGWPINNEWDRFVANFPSAKIQSGKTLDDVFHWKNIYTWSQETPILAWGANTLRILRGGGTATEKAIASTASSVASTSYGFRPFLEYKEVY